MEDGLERNFTWLKTQHYHENFINDKPEPNTVYREKKVFLNDDIQIYNNVKIQIKKIKKNKIE